MRTFHPSIRRAVVKGSTLAVALMLAFSLMPARSAFAVGDVGTNEVTCTETATITQNGLYVRGGGVSTCTGVVPLQTLNVRFSIDFVPVDSGSKTCTGTASCSHDLAWRLKLPGGHVYCAEVTVIYANSLTNYDMNCEWLWF